MITINSTHEAVKFAQTFGKDAVNFVLANKTLNMLSCEYLNNLIKTSQIRCIEVYSFNDGNNCYDVVAHLRLDDLNHFSIQDIEVVRTGIGYFHMTLEEAMASRSITIDQCHKIITARNNIQIAIDALTK